VTNNTKLHLVKLDHISFPKRLGGWGILNLWRFGWALLQKSLWSGLFGDGIWGNIIRHEYLKDHEFPIWMHKERIGIASGLAIWLSFKKINKCFLQNLCWRLGFGYRTGSYTWHTKRQKYIIRPYTSYQQSWDILLEQGHF